MNLELGKINNCTTLACLFSSFSVYLRVHFPSSSYSMLSIFELDPLVSIAFCSTTIDLL